MRHLLIGAGFLALALFLPTQAQAWTLELEMGAGPTLAAPTASEKNLKTDVRIGVTIGHSRKFLAGFGYRSSAADIDQQEADLYLKGFILGKSGDDNAVFARFVPGQFEFSTDSTGPPPEFTFGPSVTMGAQTNQDGRFGLLIDVTWTTDFDIGELFEDVTTMGKLIVYFGPDIDG